MNGAIRCSVLTWVEEESVAAAALLYGLASAGRAIQVVAELALQVWGWANLVTIHLALLVTGAGVTGDIGAALE